MTYQLPLDGTTIRNGVCLTSPPPPDAVIATVLVGVEVAAVHEPDVCGGTQLDDDHGTFFEMVPVVLVERQFDAHAAASPRPSSSCSTETSSELMSITATMQLRALTWSSAS